MTENKDFEADIVTLTDEEGNDIDFEIIGELEHEGNVYFALVPCAEDGDEFVILVRADIIEEIKQIKKRVYRNLAEITAKSELPYNLSVSIGITKVDKRKSLKEAIEKADAAMYEEKKKRSKR